MKRLINWIIIIVLFITGCTQITQQNVRRIFQKKYEKRDFIEFLNKKINDSKITNLEKKILIKELSSGLYLRNDVNYYLREKAFRNFRNNKILQKEVFNAIVVQHNISNIDFFFEQLKNKTKYKEQAREAILAFGISAFPFWKKYLYSDNDIIRNEMCYIFDNLPAEPIDLLLEEYLSQYNHKKKEKLIYFFEKYKSETAKEIKFSIKNKTVTEYDEVSDLINILSSSNLNEFRSLFMSSDENTLFLARKVFQVFGDDCLLYLSIIYQEFTELEPKKQLIYICEDLSSISSQELLEKWLLETNNVFEKEMIVRSIVKISSSFPLVFVPFLEDINVSYDIIQAIPEYVESNPKSVKTAFYNASDIGKIKLINIFMEKDYNEILIDILPKMQLYSTHIKKFVLLNLIENSLKNEIYFSFVKDMLKSEDLDEFAIAAEYSKRNEKVFREFISSDFNNIAKTDEKEILLIDFFSNSETTQEIDLIIKNYKNKFSQNDPIADLWASILAQNVYIGSDKLKKAFTTNNNTNLKLGFVNLLTHINNKKIADWEVFSDLAKKYYFDLEIQERFKILRFMDRNTNLEIMEFIQAKYNELELIEKKLLVSSLNKFSWNDIFPFIKRLIYLGDEDDFYVINDIINRKFGNNIIDNELLDLIIFYHFKRNDFSQVDKYRIMNENPDKKSQKVFEICDLIEQSNEFLEYNEKITKCRLINPVIIYKALYDSLWIYQYILSHENLSDRQKRKFNKLINILEENILLFENDYLSFFEHISYESEFDLMGEFEVKVRNYNFQNLLNCGNVTFTPADEYIFLELFVKLRNPTQRKLYVSLNNFYLQNSNENSISLLWEGEYYYKFNGKVRKGSYEIAPEQEIVLSIIFEIDLKEEEYYLTYNDNKMIGIITPIKIQNNYSLK